MKIVAIYTGQGLQEPLSALLKKEVPGLQMHNIVDDSLIADVIAAGCVTKSVAGRLLRYYEIAQGLGADYILNTCSSVGEVVALGEQVVDTPIIRIDRPMAEAAVRDFSRIGVVATLPTTLDPTIRLVEQAAEKAGKKVGVVDGLADGAYQALVAGRPQEHDERIEQAARRIAGQVDCIVLAQGSMMRMQERLAEVSGKPILSSPVCCANYIRMLA